MNGAEKETKRETRERGGDEQREIGRLKKERGGRDANEFNVIHDHMSKQVGM